MKKPNPKSDYPRRPHEEAAVAKYRAARDVAHPRLKIAPSDNGLLRLIPDHPDELTGYSLLMEALGTTNPDFCRAIIRQIADATERDGQPNVRDANFLLSVILGAKSRDELEAMLAAQMATVHVAMMTIAKRLNHLNFRNELDSAERSFNKLARTYLSQMEGLKRYRTGGEQKMTVQHVTVSEGGQAIVGNVTQGARDPDAHAPPSAPLRVTKGKSSSPIPAIEDNTKAAIEVRNSRKTK